MHQLGHQLIALGFDAYMHYYTTPDSVDIIHENYKKYQVPYVTTLDNSAAHLMILPETHLSPIFNKKYNLIRKAIWWLSVTNYYITQENYINTLKHKKFFELRNAFGRYQIASFSVLKKKNVLHIAHSYYSQAHLLEKGIKPVARIADYMNEAFFDLAKMQQEKEDIIIYNPKKNDDFLDELIRQTPGLNWKPLQNMTPENVADWMSRAKLYIDFGFHPGKERMPREACIMRCCMIIGKTGSAAYREDMPIPEKYRFEKEDRMLPAIIARIKACLENYAEAITDFAPYREALHQEEAQFAEAVKHTFVKV